MLRGSYCTSVATFIGPFSSPQVFLSAAGKNTADPQPDLPLYSTAPVPPYWIPRLRSSL
ncbi:hypothetical protein ASPSYDRAFT_52432 [Aspergillus sydowii CBS 593.65]|uniref:Uncharacterized protein n=1 Tax=Aspergillus sydowii CBS 593.65 TaxID=1036612 RepID=A0A1L9SYC3_9EURO|nr:uncharacterized protein ASPSYDRAFT_52432 [Aspergillus sydowii CBS 593.65]OJJ52169.1 hypothetical protein ASPSYDRAFT_52432 [Aspergillus sydowii CBS 593.65]